MSPPAPKPSGRRAGAQASTSKPLPVNKLLTFHLLMLIHWPPAGADSTSRTGARSLAAATSSASAPAEPHELPDFEEPIGNHTVAAGRDAQLSCKISKLGGYRTAWLRVEDKGILTIHSNVITRNYRVGLNQDGRTFVLTIKNVSPADKGGYMCQINSVPMRYAIGYLDVLTAPAFEEPASEQAAGQVSVSEGGAANLSCRASGHPAPSISWRREDGRPVEAPASQWREEETELSRLEVRQVSRQQAGAYLCIAANGVQPAASRRQLLDVHFAPVIQLPQVEVGAQLGQHSVKLNCQVELNPAGSYRWVKLSEAEHQEDDRSLLERDQALANSDKYDIVIRQLPASQQVGAGERLQLTLNVRQVERKDFAWYRCIASNALGVQSSQVRLYESSSFSLDTMFRGSGSAPTPPPAQEPAGKPQLASRAHTRSSWTQRAGARPPEPASSGATPTKPPLAYLLWLLLAAWINKCLAPQCK